ncbi:MAG: glycosyltransferase [Bacteroidales bacterium]|jgi:glycosyltransferase involved in cell wall biosynthesis|nr:glycosyltransferase [Bacteroidales bacterium]
MIIKRQVRNIELNKIAIVVKSEGLEFDDRVRKVCLALHKNFYVKIFIVQDNNEEKAKGVTSYGIGYEAIKLKTRNCLPRAKFLFIKTLEFYFRVKPLLKDFDFIWYNEEKTFLFPLLASRKQKFIWDQHEIPMLFCIGWKRKIFQIIERKAQKIIHANPQRIEYLKSINLIKHPEKHDYVHNYPDNEYIRSTSIPKCYDNFIHWLKGERYVYLQGLNAKDRFPFNSIASILNVTDNKIIVVGNVENEAKSSLINLYPRLKERVFFAGMVAQLDIPILMKNAQFTIVLYENAKPNNRYCEANRMYQAMSLGVPIIVGNNPSMAEVVKDKYGIVLKSDGADIKELENAILILNKDFSFYKYNCKIDSKKYVWNDNMIKTEWLK